MDAPRPTGLTASDRLRQVGLRATRPRAAVLDALADKAGHLSVEDLASVLAARDIRFARASIYNVIDDLATAGLVMLADAGPGRALYEVADEWHHHFVCRQCKRVSDVACVADARPCLEATLPGAVIDEAQVIFRGMCAECAAWDDDQRESVSDVGALRVKASR